MEDILTRTGRSISLRLIVAGIAVSLPVGISTAWLSSAFIHRQFGGQFIRDGLTLMGVGLPAIFIAGYVVLYPVERWLIRDRAVGSWAWTTGRVVIYTLAGLPIGAALHGSLRLMMGAYPAPVEVARFVITVTNAAVFGLVYTSLERALVEVQRRETQLKREIQSLRIEIDEARRAQKVQEITESDYFLQLQDRARQMREERKGDPE